MLAGSAVSIGLDVVNLRAIGCASVLVVKDGWAVDAAGLASVLGVSDDLATYVQPLGCSGSACRHAVTALVMCVAARSSDLAAGVVTMARPG